MYNFLIVLGISLIILGLYGEKPEEKEEINEVGKVVPFNEVLENVERPSYDKEVQRILEQYDLGNYTLEEVCKLLDMEKGEVILLKNIYKKYQE